MKKINTLFVLLILLISIMPISLADEEENGLGEGEEETIKITIIHGHAGHSYFLKELADKYKREGGNIDLQTITYLQLQNMESSVLEERIKDADIILVFMISENTFSSVRRFVQAEMDKGNVYIYDNEPKPSLYDGYPNMMTSTDFPSLSGYWSSGTVEGNLEMMVTYILKTLEWEGWEDATILPRETTPATAFYHPMMKYDTDIGRVSVLAQADYRDWYKSEKEYVLENGSIYTYKYDPTRPTVAILFYNTYYPTRTPPIDALIEELEKQNVNVLPLFAGSSSAFLQNGIDGQKVDVIINFRYLGTFGFNPLEDDIPTFNAVVVDVSYEDWQRLSNPLGTTVTRLIYPEVNGSFDPIVIATTEEEDEVTTNEPIPEQIDLMVSRVIRFLNLQRTQNEDKNIAVIYYNHGGGKGNIGASYLDVPASLMQLIPALENGGFNADPSKVPTQDELIESMITQGINIGSWAPGELKKLVGDVDVSDGKDYYDTGKVVLISADLYMKWFRDIYLGDWFEEMIADLDPAEQEQKRIEQTEFYETQLRSLEGRWGPAPGNIMAYEGKYIVIPYVDVTKDPTKGRVILTPQPSRSNIDTLEASYHDGSTAPTHQYLAFYLWLQNGYEDKTIGQMNPDDGFGADAIIHLGTHGTQEWLPGKENSLSRFDWPAVMTGYMPVVYPYIVDVVGEGMQAKRRGNAVLVDYMTPAIVFAGLYGDYADLFDSILGYETVVNDDVAYQYRLTIIDIMVNKTGIANELGYTEEQLNTMNDMEFENMLEEVDDLLEELRLSFMPYGLHILGVSLTGTPLTEILISMIGPEYTTLVNGIKGAVFEDAVGMLQTALDRNDVNGAIDEYYTNKEIAEEGYVRPSMTPEKKAEIEIYLQKGLNYRNHLQIEQELTQIVKALEGKVIFPKPGGDPVRNPPESSPYVVPTGGNFYNFDPRKVPTPQAWETGKMMVDEMLIMYYEEHGTWPNSFGYILWAGETTRSQGVMEAQILYLLGVAPIWSSGNVETSRVRIMSDSELTLRINGQDVVRPRFDVLTEISGLYRDTYPLTVRLIDHSVRQVYYLGTLSDPRASDGSPINAQNNVYENTKRIIENSGGEYDYPRFTDEGIPDEDDPNQALLNRVYSSRAETYGPGLSGLIEASNLWDDNSVLAERFISSTGFAYTSFNGQWGVTRDIELYKQLLGNIDATVHSRTTALYGLFDNDDVYQFLGGLNAAVNYVKGEYPDSYIMNLQNYRLDGNGNAVGGSLPHVDTLQKAMEREMYARYLNQKWADGMQEHGYAGAREFAKVIEYMWGWEALQPDLITDKMWNDIYHQFLTGDNGEWLKGEPYSYQSSVARLIQVATKEDGKYWNADPEILNQLINDYVESVIESGVSCCHHTCGNPLFDQFIAGQMSVAGVNPEDQKSFLQIVEAATERPISVAAQNTNASRQSGTGAGTAIISDTPTQNNNDGGGGAGYGTDTSQDAGEVTGYEMTVVYDDSVSGIRDFLQSPSFAASSLMAIVFIIVLVGAVFYGFKRK